MELSVAIVRYSACRHRLPVCSKCIYDWYTGRESRLQLKGTNIRYVIKRPRLELRKSIYTQTQLVGGSFSVSHGRAYVREYEKRSMGENMAVIGLSFTFLKNPLVVRYVLKYNVKWKLYSLQRPRKKRTSHIVARCTQTAWALLTTKVHQSLRLIDLALHWAQ